MSCTGTLQNFIAKCTSVQPEQEVSGGKLQPDTLIFMVHKSFFEPGSHEIRQRL